MSLPKPIVEMFQDVVTATSAAILATLQDANPKVQAINYLYGHPVEVMATLAEMEQDVTARANKFPVIILFQDFTEQMSSFPYYTKVTLNMAIAHATQATLKADQRYTQNFKPILYPLYEELMKQIANYNGFEVKYRNVRNIDHQKIDRLFWGKNGTYGNTGNRFSDFIDAIEIQNLNLTIKNKTC